MTQLGYLGLQVRDVPAWDAFFTNVLGLVRNGEGWRMDGHEQRFLVEEGPLDDVAFVGWEVDDLEPFLARLKNAGIALGEGSAGECARRRVRRFVRFDDPSGLPTELCCGAEIASQPFVSPIVGSGFRADQLGLGHIVVSARDQAQSVRFYTELLGFRLSDRIVTSFHGFDVDIVFLHANARHHSLAVGGPQKKRIHHFMLEARAMDDVGLAFDRALANGVRIMQTLGRHPNDRMFSFYARTPSGFQFEFGWGGRDVDDATWKPTEYHAISEWGHHPPQVFK